MTTGEKRRLSKARKMAALKETVALSEAAIEAELDPYANSKHETEASKYLRTHKMMTFFENLTAALVYERPEDPKLYARTFIEKLQRAKNEPDEAEPPTLVDDSNLESVFGMLDVSKKGYITLQQYVKAMESLGMVQFNAKPAGGTVNRINKETFMREAKTALRHTSATFND